MTEIHPVVQIYGTLLLQEDTLSSILIADHPRSFNPNPWLISLCPVKTLQALKSSVATEKMPYPKVLSMLTFLRWTNVDKKNEKTAWTGDRFFFTHPSLLFSFNDKCYKYM